MKCHPMARIYKTIVPVVFVVAPNKEESVFVAQLVKSFFEQRIRTIRNRRPNQLALLNGILWTL